MGIVTDGSTRFTKLMIMLMFLFIFFYVIVYAIMSCQRWMRMGVVFPGGYLRTSETAWLFPASL
jgi:hypothetical protein